MNLPATIGVTGAAGFIGSNLVHRLLDEGCTVVGVDDMSMGSTRNLDGCARRPALHAARVRLPRRAAAFVASSPAATPSRTSRR